MSGDTENLRQPPGSSGPAGGEPDKGKKPGAASRAALLLSLGKTVAATAKAVGVAESTLYAWRRKPAFRRMVSAYRSQLVSEAVGRLSRDMTAAAAELRKLLRSKSEATRLRAATTIIEQANTLRLTEDLERELAELRETVSKLDGRDRP